jgi:nicotinate phosphoribosyltransferase
MLQSYFHRGMREEAVFDLFIRRLPDNRNFLVAGGLDDVLTYLENLRFSADALAYLRSLGTFADDFLAYLATLRFTGSVYALPEGTPVFGDEPIVEVAAPMPEAQLIETFLLNQASFQTMIAAKGARVVAVADGLPVIDFGARRMHGTDAAIKAARILYMVGFASTSNVLAGKLYGIPVVGTMAHSYIEAHEGEVEAFRAFAAEYPEAVLLVDTYDTEDGVRNVVQLARELGDRFHVRGVRLDSGDLVALAFRAREILDAAGLAQVGIVVSGGLDEYAVAEFIASGAPITSVAVGTNVGVSSDAPKVDSAYKLVAYAGTGRMKLSIDKMTLPGRKQVYRRIEDGVAAGDVIGVPGEEGYGDPLLVEVMRDGVRLPAGRVTLAQARDRARTAIGTLPRRLLDLQPADPPYPVVVSARLRDEQRRLRDVLTRQLRAAR